MRTGRTLEKSDLEPNLGKGLWAEVWPENAHDVSLLGHLPREDKCVRHSVMKAGQSPLMVRKSAMDRLAAKL